MTDEELRDLAEKLRKIANANYPGGDLRMRGWFTETERREARNVAAAIESALHFPKERS